MNEKTPEAKRECVVNKYYKTINGEICVGYKYKLGELTEEEEKIIWALWNTKTPVSVPMPELFQPEDPNQTKL